MNVLKDHFGCYLFLFYVKREFIEGFEGVGRGFREV